MKRVRVVNPPYVICLSSKPARPSRGLVMPHGIGTTTPSGATMQKQGVELSPYQIRTKDYHIVKERSAWSLVLQVFISALYGVVLTLEGNQNQRRFTTLYCLVVS